MVMTKAEAFKILECDTTATDDDIRSSYKKLALRWHPDKHSNSKEATTKFQEISEAYKRLTSKDDDDDIHITMGDMFDLFAHIFFAKGTYYGARVMNHHFHFAPYDDDDDDDDDDYFMAQSDSSDDEETIHHHHVSYNNNRGRSKYCDFARPSSSSTSNKTTYKNVRNNISEAEAMKNAEELIKEEEQKKKKAEKRRAKKKRSRAKRKEKDKEQQPEEKQFAENDKGEKQKQTTEGNKKKISHKSTNKKKTEDSDSEVEGDICWDKSSAFFANAARRGPTGRPCPTVSNGDPTTSTSSGTSSLNRQRNIQSTKDEKQKEEEEEDNHNPTVIKSRELAVEGNTLANNGKYTEAVEYFTKAINLHNTDFRFFGNRSYCYDRLGEYQKALLDADVTISLAPGWPKGYFRKGRALAGLKQYSEAESAFTQVLHLDKHCDDAKYELTRTRVEQLKEMGFAYAQSERAIRLYGNVQAALDAILAGKVKNIDVSEENTYVSDEEIDGEEPRIRNEDMCSLWVGNVDPKEITERQLIQLFSKCGPIKFIRMLPSSFCAFVNYECRESAAKALQYLKGYSIGGQNIKLRYPNTEKCQKSVAPEPAIKVSGPVNGDECYFWRTTGCAYGEKCRFVHIPAHKGIDLEKVEQKYGKIKTVKKGR